MTQPVEHEAARPTSPPLPPRFVIRLAWIGHRAMYRLTGHRRGLWTPTEERWGTMLLTTTGRKSGRQREAILGYFQDGPNLVTLAMNGWGAPEPAWWLNLQAQPDTTVRTKQGTSPSTAASPRAPSASACGPLAGARRQRRRLLDPPPDGDRGRGPGAARGLAARRGGERDGER